MIRAPRTLFAAQALAAALLAAVSAGAQQPDRSERSIGPGVRLLEWAAPSGPHRLAAVEVDPASPYIQLGVTAGAGSSLSLEPLSRQAEQSSRPDRYAIAAINGDFFLYPARNHSGIPTNSTVIDGELVRTPFPRSSLIIRPNGAPQIAVLSARGTVKTPTGVEIPLQGLNQPRAAGQTVLYTGWFGAGTRTDAAGIELVLLPESPRLTSGREVKAQIEAVRKAMTGAEIGPNRWVLSSSSPAAAALSELAVGSTLSLRFDLTPEIGPRDHVLGGGPRILRDGRIAVEREGGSTNSTFASTRHPRTAVGFNGSRLYLLVVDGRQPFYSVGMSLPELAAAMQSLGCTDALNLDGGGSTTLWVRGKLANRPSDGKERPVANGLVVYSTAPIGEATRLIPSPGEVLALPGAEVDIKVSAEDRFNNPVPAPGDRVTLEAPEGMGLVVNGRYVAPDRLPPGIGELKGKIYASAGALRAEIPVTVMARPAKVEILPFKLRLPEIGVAQLKARASDAFGRLLALPSRLNWKFRGLPGQVAADGSLKAGSQSGKGAVELELGGVVASADVQVGAGAPKPLEDFEGAGGWKPQLTPPSLTGKAELSESRARGGRRSLQLEYDFNSETPTRALYALSVKDLGRALSLKMWVYGDGQGAWLRARVRDAGGELRYLTLARNVDWKGEWREVRAAFSDDWPTPLKLEAIYVIETDPSRKPKGVLWIDDLEVEQ